MFLTEFYSIDEFFYSSLMDFYIFCFWPDYFQYPLASWGVKPQNFTSKILWLECHSIDEQTSEITIMVISWQNNFKSRQEKGIQASCWNTVKNKNQIFSMSGYNFYWLDILEIFKLFPKKSTKIYTYVWFFRESLREWVSLIWAFYKTISRQTSKGDIPKTIVTYRTNLRGEFPSYRNLIQSHLRKHTNI